MTSEPEPQAAQDPPLRISPKQHEALELCRKKKFVLLSGPRLSTKTCGALVCLCDHAWNTDRANIVIVAVSQSAGMESGVWEDLVNTVIPQYMAAQREGMGEQCMEWARRPRIASVSKKPYCAVTNRFGTHSRISLESLKIEAEVEQRFKAKRYSMMYVPELSNFRNRKTFDIWSESLRMLHLRDDQHLFLADTNPSDEGEDSWIYHVWYLMRQMEYHEYVKHSTDRGLPTLPERTFLSLRNALGLLEFTIEDNIFATQERIDELVARYAHDIDLYNRYIRGMWVKATEGALFANVFREGVHVLGEVETPGNPDPLILVPEASTIELIAGWDPGNSANSGACILEKIQITNEQGRAVVGFKFLDELVVVGVEHTIEEFTERFMERMRWWEERMGRKYLWRHWSDRSVFDMKEPRGNRYYYQLIHAASGGEITLTAADRGPGSVRQRVDLWKRLLFENRLYFSADRCPQMIVMNKTIKRGVGEFATIQKQSSHKHVFDCASYPVASECYDEIEQAAITILRQNRRDAAPDGLVSVPA